MTKDIVREVTAHRTNAILTTDYEMTAWLRFYLPADLPVIQVDESWRWGTSPSASAKIFHHPLLYIANVRRDRPDLVRKQFKIVTLCAKLTRSRANTVIDEYAAYCVRSPRPGAAGKVP
jgi:hypothetical protein